MKKTVRLSSPRSKGAAIAGLTSVALLLSACSGDATGGESGDDVRLTVAAVANPAIDDLKKLTSHFEKDHPNIQVEFTILPEDTIKDRVAQDIAAQSGQFDAVMLGPDQTSLWAKNGWLANLQPALEEDPNYDVDDFIPSVIDSVSVDGDAYAVPFYAETAFLVYRADLFKEAGLEMPELPTWDDVKKFAEVLHDPANDMAGICLRGAPTSGGAQALTSLYATFGGQTYDMDWNAQLTSKEVRRATEMYVDLAKNYGIAGASSASFPECLNAYSQGHAAMWFDATVAASTLEDPDSSAVVGKNGYAPQPIDTVDTTNWFWAWSFAQPVTSKNKEATDEFLRWATSKEYIRLVGEELGWAQVPPGTRVSTYEIPEYLEAAEAFATQTLEAIDKVNISGTKERPQPYIGGGWMDTPFQQEVHVKIGQELSAVIAGNKTVDEALEAMNATAERAAQEAGYQDK